MKCRGLIAALMAIGLIAESAGIAAAHTPSDYPYEWTYSVTSRVFYYKASYPTGWPRDRFVDAMAKWNNVSGASLTFSAGGAAQASDSSCGPRDIISEQHIDGVGHNLAITVTCSTPNSTVHILVDEDDPFDNGAGTPNDPAKWDLQSTLTHELGHATRGWVLCTSPDSPGDPDPCHGKHYDDSFNNPICDINDPQNFSTMCYSSPPLPKVDSWRKRSLETHDEDIFAAAY
jgi:hypothetical protein